MYPNIYLIGISKSDYSMLSWLYCKCRVIYELLFRVWFGIARHVSLDPFIFCLHHLIDPQAWSIKPTVANKDIPAIKVDLASPQSPDSITMTDELGKAAGQDAAEEDEGLVMLRKRDDRTGEQEDSKEQRLLRCLSDPGPAINEEEEEEEEEPFLR